MPQVVSYAGVTSLGNANNIDGYDMDTVGALLNTIKAGLENDQTEDTATLVNIVANQTAIAGEKRFTGNLKSSKTPLQISDNEDVINLNFFNYKFQDSVKYYGNWSSSTAYVYNDLVWYSGWTFICKVANTNVVPDSDSTKWKQLTDVRKSYVDDGDNLKVNITGGTLNSGTLNNCSFTGSITGISKNDVSGLNNVQNILDINKEISIQTQNALDLKATISYVNTQDGLNVKYSDNYNKYVGTYSSGVTYSTNQIVVYSNSFYISLVNSNTGNTPSSSPSYWKIISDALKSDITYTDSQNTLNVKYSDNYNKYVGTYSSGVTYSTNQITVYSNSFYISLQNSNTGNTPSSSPSYWKIITDALKSDLTYVNDQLALKGAITYIDSQDSLKCNLADNYNRYRGAYNSGTSYVLNNVVSYSGSFYICIQAGTNQQPDISSSYWTLITDAAKASISYVDSGLSSKASTSYVDSGLSAKASTTDLTNGLALKCNLADNYDRFRGAYNSGTSYVLNNVVSYSGSFYICIQAGTNQQPDISSSYWTLITDAAKASISYVDSGLSSKASTSYVDSGLSGKASTTDLTNGLALKCNLADNYDRFLGAYNSGTSYVVNNVVSYSGSFYICIQASSNQQPDISSSYWTLITDAAKASISYVDSGLSAKASTSYVDSGLSGKASTTDLTNGLALKCTLSDNYDRFRGAYNSGTSYVLNNIVSYSGSFYICIQAGSNQQPDISSSYWTLITDSAKASISYVDSGLSGKASTTDLTNGLALKCTLSDNYDRYLGAYNSGTSYVINNIVSYSGSFYICIQAGSNQQPDISGTYWTVISGGGGGVSQQYVDDADSLLAPKASPTFSGTMAFAASTTVNFTNATVTNLSSKQDTLTSSSNLTVNSILSKVYSENFISISHNGTLNNYDLNYSNGCVFCLTTNPTNNMVIKLVNCGTDTGRSISFTIIYYNLSMKYATSVTAYSDSGSTQITLSQSAPLFSGGTPILSNSTILIQTFSLIRLLNGTNYCISNVSNFY